jgi:hypothetical protein
MKTSSIFFMLLLHIVVFAIPENNGMTTIPKTDALNLLEKVEANPIKPNLSIKKTRSKKINKLESGTTEPISDNLFSCVLLFTCPNDTLVNHSILPDSTGKPIVHNPSLLDTVCYVDKEFPPSCSNFAIERTWILKDINGDSCFCVQQLTLNHDLSKIVLPKDTTFQTCHDPIEYADFNITGFPTLYDMPISNMHSTLGLSIQFEDSIISTTKIKRKFWVVDSCTTPPMVTFVGSQLIMSQFANYNLLDLDIKDPTKTNLVTEICNNDPAHFCLTYGGLDPSYNGVVEVAWEYNDNNTGWNLVTNAAFNDFCFAVPPQSINIDCNQNPDGYLRRIYRANIKVVNASFMDTCLYTSDEDTLLICCPIDPQSSISIATNTLMCEGDTQTVMVTLNSNDFVEHISSNSFVNIDWKINNVLVTSLNNSASFSHFVTAGTSDYCFEANISNCAGKQLVISKCIKIDPKPICGTITGMSNSLNQISTDPDPNASKVYTICPSNDAKIAIDQAFQNCTPQWEYSFDLTNWSALGYSNTEQNTNVLPSNLWPNNTDSIYYRISCLPLSNPSACVPCNSDTIKIKLLEAPIAVNITGTSPICAGGGSSLSITNPQTGTTPATNYTWLHNGEIIGTGTTFNASEDGCYWVEATNGCQSSTSNQFCLEVCEVIPVISCPLMPNECAYLGQRISLSGCNSTSSCGGNAGLTYQWSYDSGTLISSNGCNIEHMPASNGTTYTLVVTDANGCQATTTRFIKPCSN